MVDDFAVQEVRSSGELWSEICSSLPELKDEAAEEKNTDFTDCFQPAEPVSGRWDGTDTSSTTAKWEPMEDSEIYIATLGTHLTWNTNSIFYRMLYFSTISHN